MWNSGRCSRFTSALGETLVGRADLGRPRGSWPGVHTTALGRAVVPDVYWTDARAS